MQNERNLSISPINQKPRIKSNSRSPPPLPKRPFYPIPPLPCCACLFNHSQKQSIADIPHPRHNHAIIIAPIVHSPEPKLYFPPPCRGRSPHAGLAAEHAEQEHFFHAPFEEGLDCGDGSAAGCDHGVEDDGERLRGCGLVGGEIVVVFDRVEGARVAEKAEVVHRGWIGEDGLDCCEGNLSVFCTEQLDVGRGGERDICLPSSMPSPERRTGTSTTFEAVVSVV